jgi:hypothetical protein
MFGNSVIALHGQIIRKRKQLELAYNILHPNQKMRLVPRAESSIKIVFLSIVPSYSCIAKKVDGPGFGIVCVGTSARFQMHSTFENVLPLLVHREREQKSLRSSSSSSYARAAAVAGAP